MKNLKILAALACVAVPFSPALAGDVHKGPYVSGGAGVSFLSDHDEYDDGDKITIDFDTGYALSGALGYRFGNGFRVEEEVGYRHHKTDQIKGPGASLPFHDDVTNLSLMTNAYYDFKIDRGFTPYLGAGLGVSRIKLGKAELAGETVDANDDNAFAYAVMAGVNFPVAESTSIGVEYKYLGADNHLIDYDSHTLGAKLSYDF